MTITRCLSLIRAYSDRLSCTRKYRRKLLHRDICISTRTARNPDWCMSCNLRRRLKLQRCSCPPDNRLPFDSCLSPPQAAALRNECSRATLPCMLSSRKFRKPSYSANPFIEMLCDVHDQAIYPHAEIIRKIAHNCLCYYSSGV